MFLRLSPCFAVRNESSSQKRSDAIAAYTRGFLLTSIFFPPSPWAKASAQLGSARLSCARESSECHAGDAWTERGQLTHVHVVRGVHIIYVYALNPFDNWRTRHRARQLGEPTSENVQSLGYARTSEEHLKMKSQTLELETIVL